MKRIATAITVPLLVSGTSLLILIYIANFSLRQSIVLAFMVVFLERYIGENLEQLNQRVKEKAEEPVYEFIPYHVRVDPKWERLLSDFNLIGKPDEWDQLQESIYESLPHGISCTILRKPDDFKTGLIYRTSPLGTFSSTLESKHEIAPIRFEDVPHNLRLFVKPRADGYDLGIIVPQKWWDRIKANCPKPASEAGGERWYETELTLATLSYAEFGWYWQPEIGIGPGNLFKGDLQHHLHEEWRCVTTSERDAQRITLGWGKVEPSGGWPECIEHRYFDVQHRPI